MNIKMMVLKSIFTIGLLSGCMEKKESSENNNGEFLKNISHNLNAIEESKGPAKIIESSSSFWSFDENNFFLDQSLHENHLNASPFDPSEGIIEDGISDFSISSKGNDNVYREKSSGSVIKAKESPIGDSPSFSVSFWIRPKDAPKTNPFGVQSAVFSNFAHNSCRGCFYYDNYYQAHSVSFSMRESSGRGETLFFKMSEEKFIKNSWQMITGIFDGEKRTFTTYYNGEKDTIYQNIPTSFKNWAAQNFYIGSFGGQKSFFSGDIDEFGAWKRVLTYDEIQGLFERQYKDKQTIDPPTDDDEDLTNGTNLTDKNINLALLDDAVLSGTNNGGRGNLSSILYDPKADDYVIKENWNEFGLPFNGILGTIGSDHFLRWQVSWEKLKNINYITFGGSYPNQPQQNTLWQVLYLNHQDQWIELDLEKSIKTIDQNWPSNGIFLWHTLQSDRILAKSVKVILYSNELNPAISTHLRARGGTSLKATGDDSKSEVKATLIQYLPDFSIGPPVDDDSGDDSGDDSDDDDSDDFKAINSPNNQINLALIDGATLSGSVVSGEGRGTTESILYDPSSKTYLVKENYNEYGVHYKENIGPIKEENPFFWQVSFEHPQNINYVTFAGSYSGQPQDHVAWKVLYKNNKDLWLEFPIDHKGRKANGIGGWVSAGIFEWGGASQNKIIASALKVVLFSSNESSPLISTHLRARGADSFSDVGKDSKTQIKATLIQYIDKVSDDEPPRDDDIDPPQNDDGYQVIYSPPPQNNPIVIDLSKETPKYGATWKNSPHCSGHIYDPKLQGDKDYIIMMSGKTPLKYGVRIYGGRNVRIVGLDIRPIVEPGCGTGEADNWTGGILYKNVNRHPRLPMGTSLMTAQSHSTFIEGVYIDLAVDNARTGFQTDCILPRNFGETVTNHELAGRQKILIVQNTVCLGGKSNGLEPGRGNGIHGDFIQNQVGVMDQFVIENSTRKSHAQGIILHSRERNGILYPGANKATFIRYDYAEDERFVNHPERDKRQMTNIVSGRVKDRNFVFSEVYGDGPSYYQSIVSLGRQDRKLDLLFSNHPAYANSSLVSPIEGVHPGRPPGNKSFARIDNTGLNYVSPHPLPYK